MYWSRISCIHFHLACFLITEMNDSLWSLFSLSSINFAISFRSLFIPLNWLDGKLEKKILPLVKHEKAWNWKCATFIFACSKIYVKFFEARSAGIYAHSMCTPLRLWRFPVSRRFSCKKDVLCVFHILRIEWLTCDCDTMLKYSCRLFEEDARNAENRENLWFRNLEYIPPREFTARSTLKEILGSQSKNRKLVR